MIGLDTNVVVRYLVQDDEEQARAASDLIDGFSASDQGYLSLVTVVETFWVLRRAYAVEAPQCADLIEGLLAAAELRIDRADLVRSALPGVRAGQDLADLVIAGLGREVGCDRTVTFDRRAARHGVMDLLGD